MPYLNLLISSKQHTGKTKTSYKHASKLLSDCVGCMLFATVSLHKVIHCVNMVRLIYYMYVMWCEHGQVDLLHVRHVMCLNQKRLLDILSLHVEDTDE